MSKWSVFGHIRISDDLALSMSMSTLKCSADIERLSQAVASQNSHTNVGTSMSPGLGMASAPTEEATVMIFWTIFFGLLVGD